jgi:hypothetical protein
VASASSWDVIEDIRLATAELLGALTYGQLRAYTSAVTLVPHAPDVRRADELIAFSEREKERYRTMRARLEELTDLPGPVLARQKPAFDRFFDAVAIDDWLNGVVFLAVGLPIAADFARAVAPTVDEETGTILIDSLAGRSRMHAFATDELRVLLADADHQARARRQVAHVVGLALTGFTGTLGSTDALRVLFEQFADERDATSEAVVKRMAIDVLGAHRTRMLELGLDDLE